MSLILDPVQKEAMAAAPSLRPLMEEVGKAVWEFAEVGLTEYRSAGFVAEVLRRSKAVPLPKDPSLMRPGDYTRLPGLSCRFEGDIASLLRERRAA